MRRRSRWKSGQGAEREARTPPHADETEHRRHKGGRMASGERRDDRAALGRGPTVLRQGGAAGRNRTAEGEHRSGDAADDSPCAHFGSALSATSRRRCTGGARRRRDWSPPIWAKGQGTTGDSRRLLYSDAAPPADGVATDPGNSDAVALSPFRCIGTAYLGRKVCDAGGRRSSGREELIVPVRVTLPTVWTPDNRRQPGHETRAAEGPPTVT